MRAFLCSAGSEPALAEELARAGAVATELGPGVVAAEGDANRDPLDPFDPIFARQALPDARLVEAGIGARAGRGDLRRRRIDDRSLDGPLRGSRAGARRASSGARQPRHADRARAAGASGRAQAPRLSPTSPTRKRRRTFEAFSESWLLVQLLALGRDRFLVSAAAPRPRCRRAGSTSRAGRPATRRWPSIAPHPRGLTRSWKKPSPGWARHRGRGETLRRPRRVARRLDRDGGQAAARAWWPSIARRSRRRWHATRWSPR